MKEILAYIWIRVSEAWAMVDKTDLCFISFLHWPVELDPKWFE